MTVTTSRDPVLRGEWLREGALVCAVGANDRRARELDNVVLERATFVCCDSREQAQARVRRPDRAGRERRARLARGARAPGGRRRRAARPRSRTPTSSSSSRTGSPPGTWRSASRCSSAPASAASAGRSRTSTWRVAGVGDRVVADRLDHLGPVEQACALVGREAVLDVAVLEDLGEVAAAVVLADHVRGDALLRRRALEEEREEIPERHRGDCILLPCVATRPTGAAPSASCAVSTTRAARSGS